MNKLKVNTNNVSVSNQTFEDSSFELSDESRGEDTGFHVPNKVKSLSNQLELNDRADLTGSETNTYSRGKENEENDYGNQMIDLPKLLRQLSLARVVLKRLPISTEATKLRITDDLAPVDVDIVDQDIDVNPPRNAHIPRSEYVDDDAELRADSIAIGETCDIEDDTEKKFPVELTTSCKRQKPAELIKRYCSKCKTLIVDAAVYKTELCAKCETPLTYQCARCDRQYNKYHSLLAHLHAICNTQSLDWESPKSGINYSCSQCKFKTNYNSSFQRHMQRVHEVADKSTTSLNSQKRADLIKRYCPKCQKFVANASTYKKQLCTNCETPLSYQCARCNKQYNNYTSMFSHLDRKCNTQNLDLKCPKCDYRTHGKYLLSNHLGHCLSGINFSCELCEYTTRRKTDLRRHMKTIHRDICKSDCSQCKSKSSRCEECKNRAPICETCHTGFSSTDRFQEHRKSCKQPVLECKYCPYKTDDNKKLRRHIKIEHLSTPMSQN